MTDTLVADNVDQRGLPGLECSFKRWNYLVWIFDLFAVTSHLGEDLVVPNVLHHVERIRAIFKERHRLETRTPRAVVPQKANDRQLVSRGGFEIEAADPKSTIAHN